MKNGKLNEAAMWVKKVASTVTSTPQVNTGVSVTSVPVTKMNQPMFKKIGKKLPVNSVNY